MVTYGYCTGCTMKRRNHIPFLGFLIIFSPVVAYSQNVDFDFGKIFFSVSPRILENGSITDITLGYRYTEKFSGKLHFRFSNEDKNEEFDIEGVVDSLNAVSEKNYEFFLLPIEINFLQNVTANLRAGAGIYYNYNKLNEKGYFNMPILETLGKERVNSYTNEFSMHTLGPIFEGGFSGRAEYFRISGNIGIVPIFYFHTKQKMGMIPLLDPYYADYSQDNFGSPYLYTDITIILFKYFSVDFLYDFSRLQYQIIDFDDDLNWYNPEQTVYTNSFKCEAALLIPVMNTVQAKIGVGYSWESIRLDTAGSIWNRQLYFVFDTKVNQ
jgi:hypothetical protein